jgi:hypothetical protein
MDNLFMEDSNKVMQKVKSNSVLRHFWSTVGEDGASKIQNKHRVDPVLKLYPDCPLMLSGNKDVPSGEANGSRVFCKGLHIKPAEQPMLVELQCGVTIRAYFASQVKEILVKHEERDIQPAIFTAAPEVHNFSAILRLDETEKCVVKTCGKQLPFVSNSATTGHKLQGYTAKSLLVNAWHYKNNWAYVVLSRVRTMLGLYLREPLTRNLNKFKMPRKMKAMLQKFRDTISLTPMSESEYNEMFEWEDNLPPHVE